MYFPYLYARTYEKSAILNTIATYSHNKVIPIINPFDKDEDEYYTNSNLTSICRKLVEKKKKFIVVIDAIDNLLHLKSEVGVELDNYCIYGLLASQQSGLPNFSGQQIAIIHDEVNGTIQDSNEILYHIFLSRIANIVNYVSMYPTHKSVKIEDAFQSQPRNSDYPPVSIFSDLYRNYKLLKFIGFGDYLTLGEDFIPSDGANANKITAALHLTFDDHNMLHVRHFITTPSEEPNNSLRTISVMKKAIAEKDRFLYTSGIKLLEEKVITGTNLGMLKRISLEHHIELMNSIIL